VRVRVLLAPAPPIRRVHVASGGTRSFLQRDSKQLSPCDDFAAVLWVGKCISQFSHLSATLSLLLGLVGDTGSWVGGGEEGGEGA
jgi:hypothetical protein